MPPPFRLELPDRNVAKREPTVFYTKCEFSSKIKNTDWQKYQESLPIDKDPYCPGSLNYMLSHYDRLGFMPNEKLTTTTQIMLEQIHLKDSVDRLSTKPNKYLISYYTFKDTLACEIDVNDKVCPPLCSESFATTMQKSYRPPYPYVMQRFSLPNVPFLQNRIFKWEQDPPTMTLDKFYDEGYLRQVKEIQQIKGLRQVSYNPNIYMNTDGSLPPPERKAKCVN